MSIEVVGVGLDGAAGLTAKVLQIIENASLLVGSDRHLSYFSDLQVARLILGDFNNAIAEIKRHLQGSNNSVVILVSGDPLFFGFGRFLLTKLPSEKLNFHPHLSSIQLAFNKIKVPWQDSKMISVHGRSLDELTNLLQQGVNKIAILTDNNNNPSAIARLYLALDLPVFYDFYICENLGANDENIFYFAATEIDKIFSENRNNFAALNVVILLRNEITSLNNLDAKKLPILGLKDRTFFSFSDRPGLMTKREIRLIVLGELALQSNQIVWDLGSGTGSVAIEIARLCPASTVYAVEKTAMGVNLIEKNCERFQVKNVNIIRGIAPNILGKLPAPNRVFIGGSGGNLQDILTKIEEKIAENGILVLALATLENINIALEYFKKNNWNYNLLQIQIARSTPVANLTRFSPLNPVTIITTNFDKNPNN